MNEMENLLTAQQTAEAAGVSKQTVLNYVKECIIFPALTSMRVCRTFKSVVINSAVIAVVCLVIGISVSYVWATPAGASVVMANIAALLIYTLIGLLRNCGAGR